MTVLARAFTPTANRRLNELIGFLVLVFAVLLVLALVSYSPLDPSLNTAATPPAKPSVAQLDRRVWSGYQRPGACRYSGVSAFLIPVFLVLYFAPLVPVAADQFTVCQESRRGWLCCFL